MKYFLFIISLLFVQFTFACNCELKPELDIKDWNDSDNIFTAVLTQFEQTEEKTNLTFSVSEVHKGRINKKSIRYSVEEYKGHDSFHHIDSMFTGQKWIVFSSCFVKNNELIYELKKPEGTTYCMRSKPIVDNDPYLTFINEIIRNPNSTNKTYYKGNVAFAKGNLENKIAAGVWKYYTREDLDHYWVGVYTNGKRDGKWIEKAINYKTEIVIINEEIYQSGILKERIEYNYIGEKKMHEIYSEKQKKRILYYKNTISSIQVLDRESNTPAVGSFFKWKNNNQNKK